MKNYKELQEKIQTISESQETVGGAARGAHSDFGVHRIDAPSELFRLNAFLNAFTQREFLEPKSAISQIRHKLNLAGLDFDWDNSSTIDVDETLHLPISRWGGSFGTIPTHDLKKGFYTSDNIKEYNNGQGIDLKVDVVQDDDGLYELSAKLVPNSEGSTETP